MHILVRREVDDAIAWRVPETVRFFIVSSNPLEFSAASSSKHAGHDAATDWAKKLPIGTDYRALRKLNPRSDRRNDYFTGFGDRGNSAA